jgi:hypothetical protein
LIAASSPVDTDVAFLAAAGAAMIPISRAAIISKHIPVRIIVSPSRDVDSAETTG